MNKKNYVSLKNIINDIAIKSGNKTDFSPDDVLYMANGIAELIIPGTAFIEEIALIDVDNYKGKLPSNFKYVSQALYREEGDEEENVDEITGYTRKLYGTDCELEVSLNCDPQCDNCNTKRLSVNIDHEYLIRNPGLSYAHSSFFYGQRSMMDGKKNKSLLFPQYSLMKRTTNNFFNVPYHINECINFNADVNVEYNIEYPHIITTFKKGTIILAYLGIRIDEEGYRMIPDVEEVYEAIYYTIREKLSEQRFDNEPNQNNRLALQMSEQKAMVKRRRATAILNTLEPDEWEMLIRNHLRRTIPQYSWEATGNRYISDKAFVNKHTIPDF